MSNNTLPYYDEDELDENFNENWLFIGLMPDEDPENIRVTQLFNREEKELQFIPDDNPINEGANKYIVYDPGSMKSEFSYPNLASFSKPLLKELEISVLRYNHYIDDPEGIRPSEISKYNKEWMSNALNLIYPNHLLKTFTEKVKDLFQEVLANYSDSMKRAILNYILRAPAERKRLHILMIPREVPPSSDKIALQGGYSLKIFKEWHKAKKDAEAEVKIKMISNNIVMGSLVNWWYDFRDIKLFKFNGLKVHLPFSLKLITFIYRLFEIYPDLL